MNGLVVDDLVGTDIGQRFQRKASALFFLVNPGDQCLFDDPTTRALKPGGQLVNFVGQQWGQVSTLRRVEFVT